MFPRPSLRLQLTGQRRASRWTRRIGPSPASPVGTRQTSTTWADGVRSGHGRRLRGGSDGDGRRRQAQAYPLAGNRKHKRPARSPRRSEPARKSRCYRLPAHDSPRSVGTLSVGNTTKIGQTTQDQPDVLLLLETSFSSSLTGGFSPAFRLGFFGSGLTSSAGGAVHRRHGSGLVPASVFAGGLSFSRHRWWGLPPPALFASGLFGRCGRPPRPSFPPRAPRQVWPCCPT